MYIKSLIKYLKDSKLPGIIAHKEMSFTNRNFEKPQNAIPSAVSILLFKRNSQIYFPLIKRTEKNTHHKKQIALPGGRLDLNESIDTCAIREIYEELGIDKQYIKAIKHLTELYIPVSNHLVFPVICHSEILPKFILNEHEVEKIILCDIETLLNFEKQISKVKLTDNLIIEVPSFIYQDEIIWGATALILNEFRHILKEFSATNYFIID